MRATQSTQTRTPPKAKPVGGGLMQKNCGCGNHTIAGGECAECDKGRHGQLRSVDSRGEDHLHMDNAGPSRPVPSLSGDPYGYRLVAAEGKARATPATTAQGLDPGVRAAAAVDAPGAPLPTPIQREAELRYGQSFADVRIHTDGRASGAAAALQASAYTLGTDIAFASNRYAPDTALGQLLLQHELRHVAQQHAAAPSMSPQLDSRQSTHERDARRILDPAVQPLSVQRVQCAPEDVQFSIGDGIADSVGRQAFGERSWPFIKAVLEGFVGGMKSDVQGGRADSAKSHLAKLLVPWNAAKFYVGYLVGLAIGLISPITDLVKGVIGLVKLGISALEWLAKWSPVGVAVSPERQQKIARLAQKFSELSVESAKAMGDFIADPRGTIQKFAGFLNDMMQMALGKAREIGAKGAHAIFDFLEREFYEMGKGIGEVIGTLIAQVLLLVFSEAIGNLISKGASFVGKAAEFAAGKAVEVFNWVKQIFSQALGLLRNAVKGALKLFEGLVNKAVDAFDALVALFNEAVSADLAAEKVAAGVGRGAAGSIPNTMESRMVSSIRTSPAKVADLTPPKVHPSNVGKDLTKPASKSAQTSVTKSAPSASPQEVGNAAPKNAPNAAKSTAKSKKGMEASRTLENAYIKSLKERYPKLKNVDIRPRARPAASRLEGAPEFAFEERMQTTQGNYSLTAYSDGRAVAEFDGISVDGWVEEIKIEQNMNKVDEIVTQLRKQADFAEAYGLKGVRYSVAPPSVAEEVEARVAAERLRNTFRAE